MDVGALDSEDASQQLLLLLIGRMMTAKSFNIEAFKKTITQSWGVVKRLVIRLIRTNLFPFQFVHWRHKDKVMEGRSWCFNNQLIVLNEIQGHEHQLEVNLSYYPFWVQIKDLPFNCRSSSICYTIASNFENVMEVEKDMDSMNSYQRLGLIWISRNLCVIFKIVERRRVVWLK